MELIEQLAAALRRVDAQYHSPLLCLQAYAQFIRAVSRTTEPDDSQQASALLVVDFLIRCNRSALALHDALQAAVLKANSQEEEGSGRGQAAEAAAFAAFSALEQCARRQRQSPQNPSHHSPTGASSSAVSSSPHTALYAAESMWTEAVALIADYFRVAVELAVSVLGAVWHEDAPATMGVPAAGLSTSPRMSLHLADTEATIREASRLHVRADVVLALLQLTLQNWSAVEFGWRRGGRALQLHAASRLCGEKVRGVTRVLQRTALATSAEDHAMGADKRESSDEENEDGDVGSALSAHPLGAQVALAHALNDCTIRSVVLCEFDAVQTFLRTEVMPALTDMRAYVEKSQRVHGADQGQPLRDDEAAMPAALRTARLLSGLAFSILGAAESYGATDAALLTLQEALDQIQQVCQAASGADTIDAVQSVVQKIYNDLTTYVDTVRNKRTLDAAAKATTSGAPSSPATRGNGKARHAASAPKARGRKARRSVGHAAQRALPPPPPIGAALRSYMRHGGLPMYVTSLIADEAVRSHSGVPSSSVALLHSALAFLDAAPTANGVVALLVCAKTPLQLAAELDQQLSGAVSVGTLAPAPAPLPRSIWSHTALAPLLQSPVPPVVYALAKREASGGGGVGGSGVRVSLPGQMATAAAAAAAAASPGMRAAVPTSPLIFQPKPISKKVLAEAQKGVTAAVKLLDQRLSALLKVERAFEAQWSATETVKEALMAYYVPQACRAWVESKRLAQRAEIVRREHSAHVITRFVRYLATEKPHLHGAVRQRQQERERQDAAATVLQKYARRWLAKEAKARLLREKQSFLRDLTVVQSLYRGRQARAWCAQHRTAQAAQHAEEATLLSAHFAAVTIQRVYRGHATRLALLCAAGYAHVAMRLHYRDSRHYYATLIQKRVRGMLVRREHGAAVRARCLYGRNVYRAKVLETSCVRLQRWYRAHRRRRHPPAVSPSTARAEPTASAAAADGEKSDATAAARAADVCRSLVLRKQLERQKAERAAALEARRDETYAPFNIEERVF